MAAYISQENVTRTTKWTPLNVRYVVRVEGQLKIISAARESYSASVRSKTMFKLLAAVYWTFWLALAIGDIGDLHKCEPFSSALPIAIGGFLGIGMALAYLAGREDSE